MTQFDFGDINPDTVTGTALTELLENHRDALHSSHAGAAAPSYVTDGMVWLDTSDSIYRLKLRFLNVDTILAEFAPGAANASPALELADESEAQTGTNNTKLMTPLRVNQHFLAAIQNVDLESLGYPPFAAGNANAFARFSSDGLSLEPVLLAASAFHDVASQAEAENGTATNRSMTPLRVAQAIAALAPVLQVNGQTGDVTLTKADIGLGNVPNVDPTTLVAPPQMRIITSTEVWTKPLNLKALGVILTGGGGGGSRSGGFGGVSGSTGGTTSFGSHCSATGGTGGVSLTPGNGGSGVGGDLNIPGGQGASFTTNAGSTVYGGGASYWGGRGAYGSGGNGNNGASQTQMQGAGGGAGGTAIKLIAANDLAATETGTIGVGGGGAASGAAGVIQLMEYY